MSVVRYLKNKLTKKGHVVSKFIFQPDQNKDYSDFELLEKSLNGKQAKKVIEKFNKIKDKIKDSKINSQ